MSEHEAVSQAGPEDDVRETEAYEYVPGGKRRKGRGLKGCLAVLVALVVLVGGFYVALTRASAGSPTSSRAPRTSPAPAPDRSSSPSTRVTWWPRSAATSRRRA